MGMGILSIYCYQTSSCLHQSPASHPSFSSLDVIEAFRLSLYRESTSGITDWLQPSPSWDLQHSTVLVLLFIWTTLIWDSVDQTFFIHAARMEGNIRFCSVALPCPGSPGLKSQGIFIQNEDFFYLPHLLLRMAPKIRQLNNMPVKEFVHTLFWQPLILVIANLLDEKFWNGFLIMNQRSLKGVSLKQSQQGTRGILLYHVLFRQI